MSRHKRTVESYLSAAKGNKDLVPSLHKYARRRRLSRWEKAAITRAQNKITHAGGRSQLFVLSKRQRRAIKDKDIIVGGGIRALRFRETGADAKLRIVKGEVRVTSHGREWQYIPTAPDVREFSRKAEELERKHPGKIIRFAIWTSVGRVKESVTTADLLTEMFLNFDLQYASTLEFWFQGLAFTVDK